jgi:hypothetical protein
MTTTAKEFRKDLAFQLASILFENLPKRKKRQLMKWYKSNNDDTLNIWEDCLKTAARMIDQGDFKLDKYLEES